jgi:putative transposase
LRSGRAGDQFATSHGNDLTRGDVVEIPWIGRVVARIIGIRADRGAQFASAAYRRLLGQHGLTASMSRKGCCYDNAFIESFFSSLKYELIYHHRFATLAQARTAVFDYIEIFYNRTRLHSSLAYQTPINFESQLNHNHP